MVGGIIRQGSDGGRDIVNSSRERRSVGSRRRYTGNAAGRSRVRAASTRSRFGGTNGGVAIYLLVRSSGAVAIVPTTVPEPKPAHGRGRSHPPCITGFSVHVQPRSTLWPAPASVVQASAAQHHVALHAPPPAHSRSSPSAALRLRGGPGTTLHHVHRVRSGAGRRSVRHIAPGVPDGGFPAVGPKWLSAH